MRKQQVTSRQLEVLKYIKDFIKKNQYPPTREEIAEHFGFTKNAATDHVKALQRHKFIKVVPVVSRGIQPTSKRVEYEPA